MFVKIKSGLIFFNCLRRSVSDKFLFYILELNNCIYYLNPNSLKKFIRLRKFDIWINTKDFFLFIFLDN